MARDGQGHLFAACGSTSLPYRIYEINSPTGAATFICQTNLYSLNSLAFGPGGILYAGVHDFLSPPDYPTKLYTLSLGTGRVTLVGDTGVGGFSSLAYRDGSLWAFVYNVGLVKVDPITAIATDVNGHFVGTQELIESLCFGDDGQLFVFDFKLWVMDTLSGVPCRVGTSGNSLIMGCIEFIPGPLPVFTLGTIGRTGERMGLEIWGASPFANVAIAFALGAGGPTAIPGARQCAGTVMDLNAGMKLAAMTRANWKGQSLVGPVIVPEHLANRIRLQAIDLSTCSTSNLVRVIY